MFFRLFRLFKTAGREAALLWYACRNPATPRAIKISALLVAMYILSPIDLMPDGLPILGWVDDVSLLAFAIPAILKLLPDTVLREARVASQRRFAKWPFWHGRP